MSVSMTLRMSALAAVAATLAAPAFAGGFAEPIATPVVTPVVVPPAPVVRTGDWGGGYIGLEASGTTLSFDDTGVTTDDDFDGALYGINAGYRFDFGRFVAGGELAYTTGSFDIGGDDLDSDVLRAGVQLGYDAGRILPYITAGYANADLSADGGFDESFDGSYAGVGVDFAVTDRFTVGGQYLVHDFSDDTVFGSDFQVDSLGLRAAYNF
jgi:outer membrane immunogenic protein